MILGRLRLPKPLLGGRYIEIESIRRPTMAVLETDTQMHTANLTALSATDLAAAIARGDVSALDAVEAHIEWIERVNSALNAVIYARYDAARSEARAADRRRANG